MVCVQVALDMLCRRVTALQIAYVGTLGGRYDVATCTYLYHTAPLFLSKVVL